MQVRLSSKSGASLLKILCGLFICSWVVFLSGALGSSIPAPGVIQALQLKQVLSGKKAKLETLESENIRLEKEIALLKKNRPAQEQEIRKTLGYIGKNEVILDFSK